MKTPWQTIELFGPNGQIDPYDATATTRGPLRHNEARINALAEFRSSRGMNGVFFGDFDAVDADGKINGVAIEECGPRTPRGIAWAGFEAAQKSIAE